MEDGEQVDIVDTELAVSVMNQNTMLKYLKRRHGDISFILDRYDHSEEYIADPNNWISWGSAKRLMDLISEFHSDYADPRSFYTLGLHMQELRSVGVLEQLVRLFPSPKSVVARIPELNRRFNRVFEMHVSDVTRSSAEVIVRYREDFRDSYVYGLCLWIQGIVASIPLLWDLPAMEIEESHCLFSVKEIVDGSYAYLGISSEFRDDKFLVDGDEVARQVSGDSDAGTIPYLATRSLTVKGIPILKEGVVYGAAYCRYQLSWQNKSFLMNLRELTVGRIAGYLDSRKALQEQLEYTEKQFFEIQRLHEELQLHAQSLEHRVDERTQQYREQKERAEKALLNLKATQDELIEAEKLAAVGRLSFGVGHDLRNTLATAINSGIPLSKLMADLQQVTDMLEQEEPAEEIAEYMSKRKIHLRLGNTPDLYQTMMNSLTQALENVKSLEGYAVQDGSDFQEVQIEEVIERVLRDHREELGEIQIETSFAEQEYAFQGNPLKIYDLFQNLVVNALEAMETTEDPVLRIVTQVIGSVHQTTVEDNGCGMSEEVMKHAFEPFYTTRELTGGRQRGLGLFNVWRLVEQHSGKIEIESEPRQGSSLRVSFNLAP